MNPNSFKLDNSMGSFRLDRELAYYYHRFREFLRDVTFEILWVWKATINNLRKNISDRDFNEPYELFSTVVNFFNEIAKWTECCVYQHQLFDNSLVLYIWDSTRYSRKVFLNDVSWYDYFNERLSLEHNHFVSNIRWNWDWSKAAVNIYWYIICFYIPSWKVWKKVRFLNALFTVWLADIIKAKLAVIENKYLDPRTSLYNAKYIQEMAEKWDYSIIKIDIDDFKIINDTYWHAAWDKVLEEMWNIFRSSVWINDKPCREWWDEFLILVDTKREDVIQNIIERINKKLFVFNSWHHFIISLSVWYCVSDWKLEFKERMSIADVHMYNQKNQNSQLYRLAKKITDIRDPEIYESLLKHIIANAPSKKYVEKMLEFTNSEN